MALPTLNPDSALVRGLRTLVQALIGFSFGLLVVVWAVPGVPAAVVQYIDGNWVQLATDLGIPTAVASFIWNLLRKDVSNV